GNGRSHLNEVTVLLDEETRERATITAEYWDSEHPHVQGAADRDNRSDLKHCYLPLLYTLLWPYCALGGFLGGGLVDVT
ncbi:unnamed protein product, partial [Amoebophrya sp. A25]